MYVRLIADDNIQPDIHTLYIFFNNLYSMFIESLKKLYMLVISASIIIRYHI